MAVSMVLGRTVQQNVFHSHVKQNRDAIFTRQLMKVTVLEHGNELQKDTSIYSRWIHHQVAGFIYLLRVGRTLRNKVINGERKQLGTKQILGQCQLL